MVVVVVTSIDGPPTPAFAAFRLELNDTLDGHPLEPMTCISEVELLGVGSTLIRSTPDPIPPRLECGPANIPASTPRVKAYQYSNVHGLLGSPVYTVASEAMAASRETCDLNDVNWAGRCTASSPGTNDNGRPILQYGAPACSAEEVSIAIIGDAQAEQAGPEPIEPTAPTLPGTPSTPPPKTVWAHDQFGVVVFVESIEPGATSTCHSLSDLGATLLTPFAYGAGTGFSVGVSTTVPGAATSPPTSRPSGQGSGQVPGDGEEEIAKTTDVDSEDDTPVGIIVGCIIGAIVVVGGITYLAKGRKDGGGKKSYNAHENAAYEQNKPGAVDGFGFNTHAQNAEDATNGYMAVEAAKPQK